MHVYKELTIFFFHKLEENIFLNINTKAGRLLISRNFQIRVSPFELDYVGGVRRPHTHTHTKLVRPLLAGFKPRCTKASVSYR